MTRKYIRSMAITMVVLVAACGDDASSIDQSLRNSLARVGVGSLDPGPPPDPALVSLGQALMFDKELSGNRDISCATCHHPFLQTADSLALSIGTGGSGLGTARVPGVGRVRVPRNAPDVFNRGAPEWRTLFLDGRATVALDGGYLNPAGAQLPAGLDSILAVQAMFPVTSRDEMRGNVGDIDVFGAVNEIAIYADYDFTGMWRALAARLTAIPEYVGLFAVAYPEVAPNRIGFEHAANAIAAFEIAHWTLLDSPWDRYLAGADDALSDDAKRGARLFYGKAGCVTCHSGNLLTDQRFHSLAVPQIGPGKGSEAPLDFGRGRVTGEEADRFAFRTPPLRNVAITGPWMHDGAYATLEGALRHHLDPESALLSYDAGQLAPELRETFQDDPATIEALLASLDPSVAEPLDLSDDEVNELLAFLESLTDPRAIDLRLDVPERVPSGLPVAD